AGTVSYAERIAAGTRLARGIIDAAHRLGMSTGLAISPLEFPREFAAVLPGAMLQIGLENLTIGPGGGQRPDDATLMGLVKAQIRAYLTTYPEIDVLYLTLPEFPAWVEHAEAAWKEIDTRTGVGTTTSLEKLIDAARERRLISSGQR